MIQMWEEDESTYNERAKAKGMRRPTKESRTGKLEPMV